MRTFSYIILILLSWISSGYVFSPLTIPLYGFVENWLMRYPILFLTSIPSEIIKVLIFYRVICWFKNKSLAAPDGYLDWVSALGTLVSIFILLVLSVYAYLIAVKANGMSGVPLGFAFMISGIISIILVLVVELRSFYALIPTNHET